MANERNLRDPKSPEGYNINDERVNQRVAGRKLAGEALRMFLSINDTQEGQVAGLEFFVAECQKLLPPQKVERKPQPVVPLTNRECIIFEEELMPYGKYMNLTIGDIMDTDPDYLHWLGSTKFISQLNSYLAAKRTRSLPGG